MGAGQSSVIATPADRLKTNLADQAQVATQLETLVLRERAALVARDWDAILLLCDQKNDLVLRLQSLARDFDQGIAGRTPADVLAPLGLLAAHQDLMNQAAQLQRANRESRTLFDHHRAKVGTALQMMNRGDATRLYGRNGMAGNGRLSNPLAEA